MQTLIMERDGATVQVQLGETIVVRNEDGASTRLASIPPDDYGKFPVYRVDTGEGRALLRRNRLPQMDALDVVLAAYEAKGYTRRLRAA